MSEGLERLAVALGEGVRRNEPLAAYTNMRVGGPADLLLACATVIELVEAVRLAQAHGVDWWVLGGGCNVLVADAGVRGLTLVNRATATRIEADGVVWAEAGASLAALARRTAEQGLAGLEWAAGLPGTVGGAVVGNAGAFGGDMAATLRSLRVLERDGTLLERPAGWLDFGYRESRIKRLPLAERPVVLEATFALQPSEAALLTARVAELLEWRRTHHPSGATMGSTFQNAPDVHAGRLIEGVGLKEYRIGGAEVAKKHANFFLNIGNATAADVLALIRHVQAQVEQRLGVRLELEVELVGEWAVDSG